MVLQNKEAANQDSARSIGFDSPHTTSRPDLSNVRYGEWTGLQYNMDRVSTTYLKNL